MAAKETAISAAAASKEKERKLNLPEKRFVNDYYEFFERATAQKGDV